MTCPPKINLSTDASREEIKVNYHNRAEARSSRAARVHSRTEEHADQSRVKKDVLNKRKEKTTMTNWQTQPNNFDEALCDCSKLHGGHHFQTIQSPVTYGSSECKGQHYPKLSHIKARPCEQHMVDTKETRDPHY